MYRVDGFEPIYGKNGKLNGVKALRRVFELTPFTVWFGNIKRNMFICKKTMEVIYYYLDLRNEKPQMWYSKNWEDYQGIERIKAKDLQISNGEEK